MNLTAVRDEMLIIPNRTRSEVRFIIRNDLEKETFSYYLTDLSGHWILEGTSIEGEKVRLSVKAGMYIVTLKTNTTWYSEKIIIQ